VIYTESSSVQKESEAGLMATPNASRPLDG